MITILLLVQVFSASPAMHAAEVDRGPHGEKNLDIKTAKISEHDGCDTCHAEKKGKITIEPEVEKTCSGCHGDAPHSGAAEHMGMDLSLVELEGELNCLTCHLPHRAGSKDVWAPSFIASRKELGKPLGKDLVLKPTSTGMLRRFCTDCHRW